MLIDTILRGEVGPAARLMRDLDDEMPQARETLRQLYPHTGRAHVIGITGSPGAGKSCLTNQMISHFRKRGQTVGVVAIDPSSPFSGGAILGDRVRMQVYRHVQCRAIASTDGDYAEVSWDGEPAETVPVAWLADAPEWI